MTSGSSSLSAGLFVAAASVLTVGSPSTASAHRLDVVVTIRAEELDVEALYDGGGGVKDARVEVVIPAREEAGREILEGSTDEEGRWSFRPPENRELRITVDDRQGHRRSVTIRPEQLRPLFSDSHRPTIGTDGPSTLKIVDTREQRAVDRIPGWLRAAMGVGAILILACLAQAWRSRKAVAS